MVGEEGVHLGGRRRQSGQVERDAADQSLLRRLGVGGWGIIFFKE
jgi:hypothetical protein